MDFGDTTYQYLVKPFYAYTNLEVCKRSGLGGGGHGLHGLHARSGVPQRQLPRHKVVNLRIDMALDR